MFSNTGHIIGAIEVFRDNTENYKGMKKLESLKESALNDTLTGIGNRRFFEKQIKLAFDQTARHNIPFGLLLIDLDSFDIFVEKYGQTFSNNILKTVAKTLEENVRIYDVICRWEGEKFIAIIKHVDEELFRVLAEKLRMLIENSFPNFNGQMLVITASIGASYIESGDSEATLLRRANKHLNMAKLEGGNMVVYDRSDSSADNENENESGQEHEYSS